MESNHIFIHTNITITLSRAKPLFIYFPTQLFHNLKAL